MTRIAESKKGISSNQLERMLGTTYRTAWHLSHRIRGAMAYAHQPPLLGIVGADETFVGSKYRYQRTDRKPDGSPNRGPRPDSNKSVILGAVERSGQVRLRLASDRTRKTLHEFLIAEVGDGAEAIFTDD